MLYYLNVNRREAPKATHSTPTARIRKVYFLELHKSNGSRRTRGTRVSRTFCASLLTFTFYLLLQVYYHMTVLDAPRKKCGQTIRDTFNEPPVRFRQRRRSPALEGAQHTGCRILHQRKNHGVSDSQEFPLVPGVRYSPAGAGWGDEEGH